jgi:hypothetical protein
MAADSDSNIAWHRAQIKKHRETLSNFESIRFSIGAGSKKTDQTDLKRKIRQSEQIIAAYEKRNAKRPRATDRQSLAIFRWTWAGSERTSA